MEIEIAFNLLKEGDAVKDKDPIDAHYEKLNTEIEVKMKRFQNATCNIFQRIGFG